MPDATKEIKLIFAVFLILIIARNPMRMSPTIATINKGNPMNESIDANVFSFFKNYPEGIICKL